MSAPPIEAVVFDVFGTLVDWRGTLIDEMTAFGTARGLAADWAAVADAWRAAYVPMMDRVRRGELPWTPLDGLHRLALDELAPRFGLGALDDAERAALVTLWHRLRPWPDTVPGLARLRARFITGTLSNGNVRLLVDLVRGAPLPVDVILSAQTFGHYKPDPEVYRGAAAMLSVPPARLMLVAAHNDDLRAAAREGLRTGFVARPREHGPGQAKDLTPAPFVDVAADDLVALAERLGA